MPVCVLEKAVLHCSPATRPDAQGGPVVETHFVPVVLNGTIIDGDESAVFQVIGEHVRIDVQEVKLGKVVGQVSRNAVDVSAKLCLFGIGFEKTLESFLKEMIQREIQHGLVDLEVDAMGPASTTHVPSGSQSAQKSNVLGRKRDATRL